MFLSVNTVSAIKYSVPIIMSHIMSFSNESFSLDILCHVYVYAIIIMN